MTIMSRELFFPANQKPKEEPSLHTEQREERTEATFNKNQLDFRMGYAGEMQIILDYGPALQEIEPITIAVIKFKRDTKNNWMISDVIKDRLPEENITWEKFKEAVEDAYTGMDSYINLDPQEVKLHGVPEGRELTLPDDRLMAVVFECVAQDSVDVAKQYGDEVFTKVASILGYTKNQIDKMLKGEL